MSAVLDTHAVLWYLENSPELSNIARTTVEDAVREARDVYVSVISIIETVYLVERKRLPVSALHRLRNALSDPDAGLVLAPVDAKVANSLESISRNAVPDMPDRIVAATALHLRLPLITRDRRLQAAGITTIW
jgi:PIN domain nuclease of toxin-antitoxin system